MEKKKIEYPKLPKAFKIKWLKALRSGEFKQGNNRLKREVDIGKFKHCCLGVACEIAGAQIPLSGNVAYIIKNRGIKGISKVPSSLIGCGVDSLPDKLADMNDRKISFKRIASWIEKNL